MDLIERYLNAIRRNLPARGADDVIAELRDALANRTEDREAALGRPLTAAETEALVKDFGHPWVVAARYRRQQWLIGPDVFPFYFAVVRIVALVIAAVLVAIGLARALFGDRDPLQIMFETIGSLSMSLVINIGAITIIFALLERAGFPADHIRRWSPAQLPDVTDKQPGPRESAAEVALGIAFLLWWSGVISLPYAPGSADFRIEAAPIFMELYWPILILAAARLVHNLIQWLRPRWTLVRRISDAGTAIAWLVLLVLVYRAGHWAVVVSTGMPLDQAAQLEASLNLALKIAIVVSGVMWTLNCMRLIWSLARPRLQPLAV